MLSIPFVYFIITVIAFVAVFILGLVLGIISRRPKKQKTMNDTAETITPNNQERRVPIRDPQRIPGNNLQRDPQRFSRNNLQRDPQRFPGNNPQREPQRFPGNNPQREPQGYSGNDLQREDYQRIVRRETDIPRRSRRHHNRDGYIDRF
jgi:hypothetical protein